MFKKKESGLILKLLVRLFAGLLFIIGLFLAAQYLPSQQIAVLILALLVASLLLDVFNMKNKVAPSFLKHVKEKGVHFSSVSYYLLGITLILAYLDTRIVFIAAAMTLLGTIGGQIIRKFSIKSLHVSPMLQGMVLAFFLNGASGFAFINSAAVVIPMAIVATFIETFSTYNEDNLLVPIVAGIVGQISLIIIS